MEGSEQSSGVSALLSDFAGREQERDKSQIIYYIVIAIIGVLFLITMIVGAVNLHQKSANRKPSCVLNANKWRLPTSIQPKYYNLELHPSLANFTFNGTVDIMLDVLEETNCILLHSEELEIESVVLRDRSSDIPIVSQKYNNETLMLQYNVDMLLQPGTAYYLKLQFNGKIRNDLRGFYRSYYTDEKNQTKWLATTQFEASDARTAFPCFDEPAMKANISLSITLREEDLTDNLQVFSNMPERMRTALPHGTVVLFETTPPMSTYLLAYAIGEFDWVQASQDGIDFRVLAPYGKGKYGQYALQAALNVTRVFNEFFGIKYALPKMDLIAIPDFRAGAMENWGLITFRERYLLIDESSATLAEKQAVAEVVAHEIAHQWSGNLVTMKWWSDLYLNEGFATFYETFAMNKINPDWNTWQQFLYSTIQPLLLVDSQQTTHPLVYPVNRTHQIEAIFDTISYNKGGTVLRMLYNYLGEQKFRDWMRIYFRTFQYNNTYTNDLLGVLKQVVQDGDELAKQVEGWMRQPGYPVVSLKKSADNQYTFTQKRFLSSSSSSDQASVWWIPLTYIDNTGKKVATTFAKESSDPVSISADWIKVNVGQTGLYRVNYPTDMWGKLSAALRTSNPNLAVADRFGLVDDVFALASSGNLKINIALELAASLAKEETFVIWNALLTNLGSIAGIISREPMSPLFDRFVVDILSQDVIQEVGWEEEADDTPDTKRLRSLVLSAACVYGHAPTIAEAKRRFNDMVNNNGTIIPDLRALVYNTIVREGGEREYEWMLNRFLTTTDASEQYRCMYALAATRLPALLKKTLRLTLSPHIRSQDGAYVIRAVSRNTYGTDIAWDFIRENYDAIVAKFGRRTVDFRLISGATGLFSSDWKYREVEDFFTTRTDSKSSLDSALETIRNNQQFLKLHTDDLTTWLKTKYSLQ